MSGRVQEVVETKAGKVRVVETEGRRKKGRSRKEMGRKRRKLEAEARKLVP